MHDRTCAECGAPVGYVDARSRQARWCSKQCRSRSRERTRPSRPGRGWRIKVCVWCGKEWRTRNSPSVCCSRSCVSKLQRQGAVSSVPWVPCPWCGLSFIARWNRTACSESCMRKLCPGTRKSTPITYGACLKCGGTFIRRVSQMGAYCSDRCRRQTAKATRRHKMRVTALDTPSDPVTALYLAERDGWRCRLCGKRVDRTKAVPHPHAPSIDHIVPAAAGGPHTFTNTQLAHFICNSRKRDAATPRGEQLRLIG